MSLNSALNSSVLGIKAHSQTIGVVADNTANMRTTSYKRSQTSFSTFISSGSGNDSSTSGVEVQKIRYVDEQGISALTGTATNFAIAGQGFAVVRDSGGNKLFSRLGDFSADKTNTLVNTAGHTLMGWATDQNGVPLTSDFSSLDPLVPIQLPTTFGEAHATSSLSLVANLPVSTPLAGTVTDSETLYDSLGVAHSVNFVWTKSLLNPQKWNLAISSADALSINQTNSGGMPYSGGTSVEIDFGSDGTPSAFNGGVAMPPVYIQWKNAAAPSTINFNLGTIGKANGLTAFEAAGGVSSRSQDGAPVGQLSSVKIASSGVVTATYDNGTTLKVYKIPVANVLNSRALRSVNGNAYQPTSDSGSFTLNSAGSGGCGTLQASYLETSTVDISFEFSEMVLAQRAFSASTQTFRTANEMYDMLGQMVR